MFETAPDARIRDAYRAAHAERGKALSDMVKRIFQRRPSR